MSLVLTKVASIICLLVIAVVAYPFWIVTVFCISAVIGVIAEWIEGK